MVTAEGTDWVDDLIHFPEGLAVHGCVEVIEVLTDDLIIESVELRQLLSRGKITFYADGIYIYIPRKPGTWHKWGQETDYKAEMKIRNDRIRSDYAAGTSVATLSRKYHLSEKSIRRILQNQ